MAPPSAQKSFCTSTRSNAACRGSIFSLNVLSMMCSCWSGLPDHRFEVERLGKLLPDRDVEIRLEGRNVELGGKLRQVHRRHDLGLRTRIFCHPAVALFLSGLDQIARRPINRVLEAARNVGIGLHPALLGHVSR